MSAIALRAGYITDSQTALDIVKLHCYLAVEDQTYDISLTLDLEAAKANESYRPYVVAAMQVYTQPPRSGVIEAEGVKWEKNEQIIEGLLTRQEAMDGTLTGIPRTWSVTWMRNQILCKCEGVTLGSFSFVV